MTFKQSTEETKLISSLIAEGRDSFEIGLAIELRQLTDRIQYKRSVSRWKARKIARELLGAGK